FSFSFNEGMGKKIFLSFIYSVVAFIIAGIISKITLFKVKGEKNKILHFANIFSNCGFIGFPIINSIYGAEGVIYTSIFNMVFSIVLWTYGVMLFSDSFSKKDIKQVLLNPGVVAVYIGVPMILFNIQLPKAIFDATKIVGDMTAPLSMLIVGNILSKVKIKDIFNSWTIYYGAFIKMILIPLGMYLFSILIKDTSTAINTIILLEAMPAAAMTSIFAADFNKDKEYAAIIIFITTLISIITIPVISMLLN
ncbi:AEC family transporter, partial [Clostridium sp.]|uniref:AEC family transporter n=1 Tax=Clostridium sp. TaxID=1506 RepID=UPI003F40A95C